jgi:hypothetical protein
MKVLLIALSCFGAMACSHEDNVKSPWSLSKTGSGPSTSRATIDRPPNASSYFDWCVEHDGRPYGEAEVACSKKMNEPVKPKRAYHYYPYY